MVDLTQFLSIGGLSALLLVVIQAFKPQLPPTALPYLPYVAVVLGIVFVLIFALATGNLTTLNAGVSFGVTGLLAGLSSVGLYEGTLNKLPWTPTPPTPPHG